MKASEVVRQQPCWATIRRRGELREDPPKVGGRVDAQQLARAHDAVNHGRSPAGGRVTDEEIIFQSDFRRPKTPLDSVLIDVHMPEADLCVAYQSPPALERVGDRIAQMAIEGPTSLEREEPTVQAPQDGLRFGMPE